jgi:hypothetical protein
MSNKKIPGGSGMYPEVVLIRDLLLGTGGVPDQRAHRRRPALPGVPLASVRPTTDQAAL